MLDRRLGARGALLIDFAASGAVFSRASAERPRRSSAASGQSDFGREHRNKLSAPVKALDRYAGRNDFRLLPEASLNLPNYEAPLGVVTITGVGNRQEDADILGQQITYKNLNSEPVRMNLFTYTFELFMFKQRVNGKSFLSYIR